MRADVTGDDPPGGDADAGRQPEVAQFLAQFAGGGQGVPGGVVEGQRGAEHGQRRVALEFVDDALVAVHAVDDALEELVELADDDFRRVLHGEGGRSDDVDEQHGDEAILAAQRRLLLQRLACDFRTDVAAEQVADALAFLEAAHHFVEAGLQDAHFGSVVDGHAGVDVAAADAVDGAGEVADGVDDAHGGEHGAGVSGDEREYGEGEDGGQDVAEVVGEVAESLREEHQQDGHDGQAGGEHPGLQQTLADGRFEGGVGGPSRECFGGDGADEPFGDEVRHQGHDGAAEHGGDDDHEAEPGGVDERDDAEHEHADAPDDRAEYRLVGGDAHDQVAHPSRVVAVGVALPSQDGFEQQPGGADAGGDGCGEVDDESDERGPGQFAESGQSFQWQQDAEEEPDADGADEVAQEHRRRVRGPGRAAQPPEVPPQPLHDVHLIAPGGWAGRVRVESTEGVAFCFATVDPRRQLSWCAWNRPAFSTV